MIRSVFMELRYWESLIFSVIVWIAVFLLVDIKRIKELWPVGLVSSALIFFLSLYLSSIGLARFSMGFLPIYGIPFFHLVWTFGAGIILINFMHGDFLKRASLIFFFGVIALALDVFSVAVGGHIHSSNFNFLHSFIFILTRLIVFVWIAEGLFEERIYGHSKRPV
jgi:hypothetical protein